jgi:hypothetical protein
MFCIQLENKELYEVKSLRQQKFLPIGSYSHLINTLFSVVEVAIFFCVSCVAVSTISWEEGILKHD